MALISKLKSGLENMESPTQTAFKFGKTQTLDPNGIARADLQLFDWSRWAYSTCGQTWYFCFRSTNIFFYFPFFLLSPLLVVAVCFFGARTELAEIEFLIMILFVPHPRYFHYFDQSLSLLYEISVKYTRWFIVIILKFSINMFIELSLHFVWFPWSPWSVSGQQDYEYYDITVTTEMIDYESRNIFPHIF